MFLLCMRMCLSLAHKRAKENCIKTNMLTWKVPWKLGYYSVSTRTYYTYLHACCLRRRALRECIFYSTTCYGVERENAISIIFHCFVCGASLTRSDFPFRFKFLAFPHHIRWSQQHSTRIAYLFSFMKKKNRYTFV